MRRTMTLPFVLVGILAFCAGWLLVEAVRAPDNRLSRADMRAVHADRRARLVAEFDRQYMACIGGDTSRTLDVDVKAKRWACAERADRLTLGMPR